ncbi:hypothetical protein V8F06_000529 [Rhypophila decipiens]
MSMPVTRTKSFTRAAASTASAPELLLQLRLHIAAKPWEPSRGIGCQVSATSRGSLCPYLVAESEVDHLCRILARVPRTGCDICRTCTAPKAPDGDIPLGPCPTEYVEDEEIRRRHSGFLVSTDGRQGMTLYEYPHDALDRKFWKESSTLGTISTSKSHSQVRRELGRDGRVRPDSVPVPASSSFSVSEALSLALPLNHPMPEFGPVTCWSLAVKHRTADASTDVDNLTTYPRLVPDLAVAGSSFSMFCMAVAPFLRTGYRAVLDKSTDAL